jgi:hypothetical protein
MGNFGPTSGAGSYGNPSNSTSAPGLNEIVQDQILAPQNVVFGFRTDGIGGSNAGAK